MDEKIGYINLGSAEDVARNALKFARDPITGHPRLVQLVFELLKQPEPSAETVEHLLKH